MSDVQFLEQRSIQANVYYPMPMCRQQGYRAAFTRDFDLPVTAETCRRIIALPFYPEMSEDIVRSVAAAISEFYG